MLDVLDQHQASGRTVLNLAVSVLSTHVDPAYRTEALSLPRLRRAALISAVIAAPLALILGPIGYGIWQDDHWHPSNYHWRTWPLPVTTLPSGSPPGTAAA